MDPQPFSATIGNVQQFLQVINACKSVHLGKNNGNAAVRLEFDTSGLSLYSRPLESYLLINAFLHKSQFLAYNCNEKFALWLTKDSLAGLESIQEAKSFELTFDDDKNRLVVHGILNDQKRSLNGVEFFQAIDTDDDILDMNLVYPFNITLCSFNFAKNCGQLNKRQGVEKTEFVEMNLTDTNDNSLTLTSVATIGYATSKRVQELIGSARAAFKANFQFKLLKFVYDAHKLSPNLNICYSQNTSDPVKFVYNLDTDASHMTIFLATALDDSSDCEMNQ